MKKAVKQGEAIELRVRITNTAKKKWSKTCHNYSHGGMDKHLFWKAGTLSNMDNVMYGCIQELGHTSQTGTEFMKAGQVWNFKMRLTGGLKELKPASPTDKPGKVTIRITEWILNATSNEITVTVKP